MAISIVDHGKWRELVGLAVKMNPLGLEGSAVVYLIIAMLCLVVALRFLKAALVPIGPLLHAIAAAAVVTLAIGAAVVLLTAALLSGR